MIINMQNRLSAYKLLFHLHKIVQVSGVRPLFGKRQVLEMLQDKRVVPAATL